MLIKSALAEFFQKSFLVPAQEQSRLRKEESDAKKLKIRKDANNCLNPSTTTGCVVNRDIIQKLFDNEKESKEKLESANTSKAAANEKRVLANIANAETARKIYNMAKSDNIAWKKLSVSDLKCAYKIYVIHDKSLSMTTMKKADFIATLDIEFQRRIVDNDEEIIEANVNNQDDLGDNDRESIDNDLIL